MLCYYCLTDRGVDHGGVGDSDPTEICRTDTVCFALKNVTFFHAKLLLDNSASIYYIMNDESRV